MSRFALGCVGWLALAALFVLGGCMHSLPPPAGALPAAGLDRLYEVHPGMAPGTARLFRSSQPDKRQFVALRQQYGVRLVIKLNSAIGNHDELPDDVVLIHHPLLPAGPVTHEEISQVLDDLELCVARLDRPAIGNCLVHCTEGRDRTGLVIALYRVWHGATPLAAFGEWIRFGSHRFPLLEEAFFRETGWHP